MGNIDKTKSKATPNEPSSLGTSSGGDPRRQETIGDTIAQTSLKRRVKRLEKKGGSRTHGLKRLYKVGLSRRVESLDEEGLGEEDASKQGRIANIDADAGINLVSTHFDADTISAAITTTTVITNDEITLAKALAELKSAKLATTTTTITITVDKGKGKIIEPEPVKKLSKKDQLMLDEELTFKLQSKEEEEERLAREKAQQIEEVNIARMMFRLDPLATKPPNIVDYKIHKEGKKTYYQIIKADGSSKIYLVFSHILKSFDREDLETLWKLIKAKHGLTRLEEGYERVLWDDLKTMFDPHVKDQVWRNQQDYRVLDWKIYDSCGVHSLRMQHMHIHMMVEKRYPLTPTTITDMLNKKLQCDHFSEMAYQLFKLLTK
ncbi:hypothetical protein Tco_0836586 [Tanacetum coccineum]